jgi:hypothetical protein
MTKPKFVGFGDFLGFVICGFGCVVGAKSPFWQHFRKVEKF